MGHLLCNFFSYRCLSIQTMLRVVLKEKTCKNQIKKKKYNIFLVNLKYEHYALRVFGLSLKRDIIRTQ